jgi:hypothetical protein
MDLMTVRFTTDCTDASALESVAEHAIESESITHAEVCAGAKGFDVKVHVAKGVSEAQARAVVAPLLPAGVSIVHTFPVLAGFVG